MARVSKRTAAAILAATFAASVAGGFAWSRLNGTGARDDDTVVARTPGVYDESAGSIPLAPELGGAPLPAVAITDMQGNSVPVSSLVGQPLVINLWFSSCVPCAEELPAFAAVHAEVGDRVRFVGIDPQDSAAKAESFAADHGVRYELYLDRGDLIGALKIGTFPATLFVDASGKIVKLRQGAFDAGALRAAIEEYLPA